MPAPSVRAVGTFQQLAGSITVNMPTHDVDDIILVVCTTANQNFPGTNTFASTGFTLVPNLPDGSGTAGAAGGLKLHIYWTRATSSAQTAPVTQDSGSYQSAVAISIQNCVTTGQPFETPANTRATTASTSVSFNNITTSNANTLIVHVVGEDRDALDTATMGAMTNANLEELTEWQDEIQNTQSGGGSFIGTGRKVTAGAIGNTTATVTSTIFHTWTAAFVGTPDAVLTPWAQAVVF